MNLDLASLRPLVDSGPIPLFATVSGAHLYGFSSADSDVDLRGAFVLPLRAVIGLRPSTETITVSRIHEGLEMDWVAHDVHKFARLMTRRNGYVMEQLYSPLVVHGGPWLDALRDIGRGCIVRHHYHHYRGFYATMRKALTRDDATVKDLLYAWRVLLTGIHLLRTGEVEAHLPTLLQHVPVDGVSELIARKRRGPEHGALEAAEAESAIARLDAMEVTLREAFDTSSLPDEVSTFNALDDYVARARLELGASGVDHGKELGPEMS